MPLTQVLQGPGHWSIELDGDRLPVPRAVTDNMPAGTEGFGHIIVTPARLEPDEALSHLTTAVYVGRYLVQRDRTILSGDHINAWLGDADGKSIGGDTVITANQGFGDWIDDIAPSTAPFVHGTIGTPGSTLDYTYAGAEQTQRDALDTVCRWFGCEWRVRNTFIFDADIWQNLYGSAPSAIATPWWDGADTELNGIRATISTETNLERYAYIIAAAGIGGSSALPDPNFPFDDPPGCYAGGFPAWKRLPGGGRIDVGDLNTFLLSEGAERWARDPTLKITTDHHCPTTVVNVGDPFYAYDPDADVFDFANEVHYGGHILWPKILRVQALVDMPVRAGMGVYFRTAEAVHDLTDYVRFETGTTRIEVGERLHTMRPAMAPRGYDAPSRLG